MRRPWADGPRTQQCDGLAFSQDTGRGVAGSLQAVNPARAERGAKKAARSLLLGWPCACRQEHEPVAAGSSAPDVPHALL